MQKNSKNSFQSLDEIKVSSKSYKIFNLKKAEQNGLEGISKLPKSLKVLLENLLRYEDDLTVDKKQILALKEWLKNKTSNTEIAYRPARVLMQDYTGIPAVADLAAMRDAVQAKNKDPKKINPLSTVDLVIDHSVMVDTYATKDSFTKNVAQEFSRNGERYSFLKWGQKAFNNFRVVPPGTGICHQVNLEYLSKVVWSSKIGEDTYAYPDTLVGTDSHTTMVNGLSVLGWGVGGIEAEAAMLGQPISMLIPEVVGFEVKGKLNEGTTATDLVLTIVQMLRAKGVVGKFVEFYGEGLKNLTLADRATIANMAPEYGATCGFFPVDEETLKYLKFSGRDQDTIDLVENYSKAQGFWASDDMVFTDTLSLELSSVVPSISGPKRPQDKVLLTEAATSFAKVFKENTKRDKSVEAKVEGANFSIKDGDIVIAAITSCTNTSNPSVMIGAGLLAKKAVELGLVSKPWVKTTLAPGSKVVTDYYEKSGLLPYLEKLGFDIVGYGCTTCIGNSGPLIPEVSAAVNEHDLAVVSVLSGNRNFEGRINPDVKMNYLASPPLVVAYAIAGTMDVDLLTEPLGSDPQGNPVFLADIWPSALEVQSVIDASIDTEMFTRQYKTVFDGDERWQSLPTPTGDTFEWDAQSTYVRKPPYFEGMTLEPSAVSDISGARVLALLGDSVTTDHISPAGSIKADSPAGRYLSDHGIDRLDFNSYGSRRGNHEVMIRGTFANIRLKNLLLNGVEGGFTRDFTTESGDQSAIYDASERYGEAGVPLVILAG